MCNGFDKMTSVWDANIKTKVSNKPTVVALSNLCTKVFTLDKTIATVIRASQATAIDSIDEKLMALQQELIQKANSKEDYDEIADEIFRLRELRQKTTVDTAARDEQIKRINDLQD